VGIFIPEHVARRVVTNVTAGDAGCVISNYSTGSHGYAQIGWHQDDGRRVATTAHRVAWVAHTGEQIPEGMTVDHICRVRTCVNPEHLRLLTNAENARDNGQVRVNKPTGAIWACGHAAIRRASGALYCRECNNERRRMHRRAARTRQQEPA
jgi:hypothetical protein